MVVPTAKNHKLSKVTHLKNIPRTGWLLRGIPPSIAEDVAGHTFEVALITYVLCKELIKNGVSIDLGKALTIALLHDVPEVLMGDIVKWAKDRIGDLKERMEIEALKELGFSDEVNILNEYLNLSSIEGVIVRIADLVATIRQGMEYLRQGYEEVTDIVRNNRLGISKLLDRIKDEKVKEVVKKSLGELEIM
ncbi:MAG: phosphohydrolase [Thermoprotei archaeon]|nr:MAG: phosphohydrolase [Thermoprotei archaeon]